MLKTFVGGKYWLIQLILKFMQLIHKNFLMAKSLNLRNVLSLELVFTMSLFMKVLWTFVMLLTTDCTLGT